MPEREQLYLVELGGETKGVASRPRAESYVHHAIAKIEGTEVAEVERSVTRVEHPSGEIALLVEHHAAWLRPVVSL